MDQQQAFNPIELGTYWLPKQGSTLAPIIDQGWDLAFWIGVVFFILVVVPMGLFVFQYKRKHDKEVGAPTGHSNLLEVGWSVVPLALVMVCFVVGFKGFMAASVAPAGAYEIQAIAQKWSWTFVYPENGKSSSELVVPANRPVRMVMSSRDVLHSFYVPAFRVKQDVVPGSYSSVWFEAVEPMKTTLECTEYCGTNHSTMLATVNVLPADEFQTWLKADENKGLSLADVGQKVYKAQCATCHTVDGNRLVGPTFKAIWGRKEALADGSSIDVDENYLRESILNPNAKTVAGYPAGAMPTFKGLLKDEQITAVIEFMKTLK
jgi:cytochrome c oxidase subunit 2